MPERRSVGRRAALKTLGASAGVALVSDARTLWALGDYHPLVPRQEGAGGWKPRVFSTDEDATLVAATERIIPATDTPGAAAAHVNQYIDWIVSEAPAAERNLFHEGLARLDALARDRAGAPFAGLPAGDQDSVLAPLSAAVDAGETGPLEVAFFRRLKQRTIEGYYRSAIGMRTELGYDGNRFLNEFEGCTHPEHLTWEPAGRRADD